MCKFASVKFFYEYTQRCIYYCKYEKSPTFRQKKSMIIQRQVPAHSFPSGLHEVFKRTVSLFCAAKPHYELTTTSFKNNFGHALPLALSPALLGITLSRGVGIIGIEHVPFLGRDLHG